VRRPFRFLVALIVYRDWHWARRLLARARQNLALVFGGLGARYVRIVPWTDFGGAAPGAACERLELNRQPAGYVRIHLAAYHLILPEVIGHVVVDAGTNEGYGAALLARHARKVIAFDVSEAAITAARARYPRPNLEFHVHDATRPFPVADGEAHVVFASEVIEHLSDPRAFVRAAARALDPDGLLIVKTPNVAFNRLENRLNPHHVSPFDARRLASVLGECFSDVRIEGYWLREDLSVETEDRPDGASPEELPYTFGEPIVVDRVRVVRLVVTPQRALHPAGAPEYLLAWARSKRGGQEIPDGSKRP
jgi:SAM-dependent methyltransferase